MNDSSTTISSESPVSNPKAKKASKSLFDIKNQGRGYRYSPAQKNAIIRKLLAGQLWKKTSKGYVHGGFAHGTGKRITLETGMTPLHQGLVFKAYQLEQKAKAKA